MAAMAVPVVQVVPVVTADVPINILLHMLMAAMVVLVELAALAVMAATVAMALWHVRVQKYRMRIRCNYL